MDKILYVIILAVCVFLAFVLGASVVLKYVSELAEKMKPVTPPPPAEVVPTKASLKLIFFDKLAGGTVANLQVEVFDAESKVRLFTAYTNENGIVTSPFALNRDKEYIVRVTNLTYFYADTIKITKEDYSKSEDMFVKAIYITKFGDVECRLLDPSYTKLTETTPSSRSATCSYNVTVSGDNTPEFKLMIKNPVLNTEFRAVKDPLTGREYKTVIVLTINAPVSLIKTSLPHTTLYESNTKSVIAIEIPYEQLKSYKDPSTGKEIYNEITVTFELDCKGLSTGNSANVIVEFISLADLDYYKENLSWNSEAQVLSQITLTIQA